MNINYNTCISTSTECEVCVKIQHRGRPIKTKPKPVNQHSTTIISQFTPPIIDIFEPETLSSYGEQLGFVCVKSEGFTSFIIFFQLKGHLVQLRNLVTVNFYNDCSWTVFVDGKDVSKHTYFRNLPEKLIVKKDGERVLEISSKLNFCVGNHDFKELCESKRKENLASFTDRNNNIIAEEVNDLICKSLSIPSTVRHEKCEYVASTLDSLRCEKCTHYRSNLVALKGKMKIGKEPLHNRDISSSSCIPNKFLARNQILSRFSQLKNEKVKLKSENDKLSKKIESLIQKEGITAENNMDTALQASIKELSEKAHVDFPEGSAIHLLFQEQLKQSKCTTSKQMRWHPIMIRWCLGLYHCSPAAYDFMRKSSFLKLPHKTTLLDYSIYTKPQSGYNPEVLRRLYVESDMVNLKEHETNVSLLFDEMKIQSELVYSKSTGKLIGFVELGDLNDELDTLGRSCSTEKDKEVATHVLAFMVRGIYTPLQFTFGYFPTKTLTCDKIFVCAWDAVCTLESIGFKVRCFVSDGASSNRKFFKMHEKKTGSLTHFAENLCQRKRKIYFVCDVPHLIKTTRNNLENSHGNKNTRNLMFNSYSISWNHLVSLKDFDTNTTTPGLYMTKLKYEHLKLNPSSRMNVRLAAQVLSKTNADALKFRGKEETKGTEQFLRNFDYFFDCFNGQHKHQGIRKKKDALNPYSEINDPRFHWLEEDFIKNYIGKWEQEVFKLPNLSKKEKRKLCLSIQTTEGIKIAVKSLVTMIKELISENPGYYVLSGRFSQDPIEQHFSAQRRRGGGSTNPTVQQFGYNELSLHTIISKNVTSIKGNTKVAVDQQVNFMMDNEVPLKRRKR